MSVITGIEELRHIVERYARDGAEAGSELVEHLSALEQGALEESLEELSELCRNAAETLAQLADRESDGEDDQEADAAVVVCLLQLLDYAEAITGGEVDESVLPAPVPVEPLDDGEPSFDSAEEFAQHALGVVAELEENLNEMRDGAHDPVLVEELRGAIRSFEIGFADLDATPGEEFCGAIESSIDALTAADVAFPVDLVLDCLALLARHLDELSDDASASLEDLEEVEPLLARLRRAPLGFEESVPLELSCSGEFVSALGDVLLESRAQLATAEAAMLAFAVGPSREHIDATIHSLRAIDGAARLLGLKPLGELVRRAVTLLSLRLSARSGEVTLQVVDLVRRMLDGLDGQPLPRRCDFTLLMNELESAIADNRQCDELILAPSKPVTAAAAPSQLTSTRPPDSPHESSNESPQRARMALVAMVRELASAQSAVFAGHPAQPAGIERVTAITGRLHDAAVELCRTAGCPVVDVVVVRAGSGRYALPLASMGPVFGATQQGYAAGDETVQVAGVALRVEHLERKMSPDAVSTFPEHGLLVMVQVDGRSSCLLVDWVGSPRPVLDKGLGAFTGRVPGASGTTLLDDGSLALILDVATLLQPTDDESEG